MIILPPPFYISGGDAVLTVDDTDITVTFDKLLMFATGTDRIPALGFDPEPKDSSKWISTHVSRG